VSWARSEAALLYLSGGTMIIGGQGVEPERRALSNEGDWREVLKAWLARHPKRAWRVCLGGRRCSLHCLEPIPGTHSVEEAEAVVGASVGTGSGPLQARLAVWAPRGTVPWVAACTPLGLTEELGTMMETAGGLLSLQPWWTSVPSRGPLASAALCDDESVTYWRSDERGVIRAAGTLLASPEAQSSVLQRLHVGGALSRWRLDLAAWSADDAPMARREGD
jgi:hypothetical protein